MIRGWKVRIVFLSDLHAHRFSACASVDEQGNNNRLMNAIGVLESLTNYVTREQIPLVIFGGDLFHIRSKIDTVTFNAVYNALKKLEPWCELVLVVGNHDQSIEQPDQHAFEPFRDFCTVIDWPQVIDVQGVSIAAFPFHHDSQQQRKL